MTCLDSISESYVNVSMFCIGAEEKQAIKETDINDIQGLTAGCTR